MGCMKEIAMEKPVINLDRMKEIVEGKSPPETSAEMYLLAAYNSAMCGELLMVFLMGLKETLDSANIHELHYLLFGYSMGQRDFEELDLNNTITEDSNLH